MHKHHELTTMCQAEVSSSNQITDDAALRQSRGTLLLQLELQSCWFIHAFPLADSDIALSIDKGARRMPPQK